MPWVYLTFAAIFEVTFATAMKYAQGFTKLGPSVVMVLAGAACLFCITMSMRGLPLSIVYPIWAGVGTVGTVVMGYFLFGEPLTMLKVLSASAIVVGVIGLKVAAG